MRGGLAQHPWPRRQSHRHPTSPPPNLSTSRTSHTSPPHLLSREYHDGLHIFAPVSDAVALREVGQGQNQATGDGMDDSE